MFEHNGRLFQRLKFVPKTDDSFVGGCGCSTLSEQLWKFRQCVVTLIYDTTNVNHASGK